jgi:hypothetical protein
MAAAFNANIGAWNTASVSNMQSVSAASPARAARTMADALGRASFDAARPVVRSGTADARACEHVRALACAGFQGTFVWLRGGSIHVHDRLFIYIYIYI